MTANLSCRTWQQLEEMYERDLKRSGFFMKSGNPPPIGTRIEVNLSIPSGSTIKLSGEVHAHVSPGGLDGRGPGLDLRLQPLAEETMWLVESALQSYRASQTAVRPAVSSPDLDTGDADAQVEQELCEALQQELVSLRRFNPFQVLGLGYGASDEDVRAAFGKLSKRYHPDRFARYRSQRAKELANEIFILIRDSYRRLPDASTRERLEREIRQKSGMIELPVAPTTSVGVAIPVMDAEQSAEERRRLNLEVQVLLSKNDFENALRSYQAQVKKNPTDKYAQSGIETVSGLWALNQGERMEATQHFEAALDLDASNGIAAAKLAEIRRQATTERTGILSRLLQRKGEP